MGLNLEPVKVSIEIETTSLARDAFYNICFITDNEKAPRTLKVERLKDLLDNGYDRSSLAYNFCVGVFAQQGIPFVYVRAKRAVESYSDAFSADDNSNFYFVVIDSKEIYEISDFNQYLSSVDENKLQFYSNSSHEISEISRGKVVNYYQELFDFSGEEDYYLNKAYKITTSHNYSSKPYPVLVEKEDFYTAKVNLETIEKRQILKQYSEESEYYFNSMALKDISKATILKRLDVDAIGDDGEVDTYKPKIVIGDISKVSLLRSRNVEDDNGYINTLNLGNIHKREYLIRQNEYSPEGYLNTLKLLEIKKH